MADYTELIEKIDKKLAEFQYGRDLEVFIPHVQYIAYVQNPGLFKVKNLCAVINMPADIRDILTAKRFFEFIRKSLLDKYGDAFLWKELEICFVVLCEHKLFEIFKADDGKAVDQASFSLNAMLGTCFVDRENLDYFARSTWGIYFSGEHFRALNTIVSEWCEGKKIKT